MRLPKNGRSSARRRKNLSSRKIEGKRTGMICTVRPWQHSEQRQELMESKAMKRQDSILRTKFSKGESSFNYHNLESDKFVPWMTSLD